MSFDEMKQLINILFQDFTFYFQPITLEEAMKNIPPDDDPRWHGYFFGRGKKVGICLYCDGCWDESKIIERFESTFAQDIDSIWKRGCYPGYNH